MDSELTALSGCSFSRATCASADKLEWNGKSWSIVNHFIPFTEDEVGANGRFGQFYGHDIGRQNAVTRSASRCNTLAKTTMASLLQNTDKDGRTVRDRLKLNRPDVGWYQIRNALKKRNESGDVVLVENWRL